MLRKTITAAAVAALLPFAWSCASDGQNEAGADVSAGAEGSASSGGATGGTAGGATGGTSGGTTAGAGGSGGGGLSIPSLINVNLENVLNDLAIRLNIDRANIPVNAQIPINVAANVCGVSINILSVSTGGQASCTARTASAELAQSVQQQIAAGGSVGGGAQGGSTASTGGTSSSTEPQTQPTTPN